MKYRACGMREVQPADARRRRHRRVVGELDADLAAPSRSNSLNFSLWSGHAGYPKPGRMPRCDSGDDRRPGSQGSSMPQSARGRVQRRGERFGQPIGQRLHQNGVVVVVLALEAAREIVGAQTGGDRKGAEVVRPAARPRRDEIGQRQVRLPVGDRFLLPQHVEARQLARSSPGRRYTRCRRPRSPPARNRTRRAPQAASRG